MAVVTDPATLSALRQGDPAGIEALWAEYGPRVLRLCRSMTGDEQHADEATTGVFLRLYEEAIDSGFEPDPEIWILRHLVAAARGLEPRTPTPRHGDESERADAIVSSLPAPQRLALALCDVQGLAVERAAGLLGESPAALRATLAEARLAFLPPWEATRRGREPNR